MQIISLVAPSFRIPDADLEATASYFRSLGFSVKSPHGLLGDDLLCAHQDEQRFRHLAQALEDSDIDIIWPVAGGYGLTRLLPQIQKLPKPAKEKLFIGCSDATALHLFLNQSWGWTTLHGPMARHQALAMVGERTREALVSFLQKGVVSYVPPPLTPLNHRAAQEKALTGIVIGGNLSLLQCSLGTAWQPQIAGKILLLEDVSERGYSVDRMLAHLSQAGLFNGIKAIIFGDFEGGLEADGSSLINPVLQRFSDSMPIPVFRVEGVGHGAENFPFPLNHFLTFR